MDDRAVETYEARCNRHHEVAPPRNAPGADDEPARPEAPTVPLDL